MNEKKKVRAVERALDILLCFLQRSSLSLTEISELTQLNKSTVYRLLSTLEGKGFLTRDPDTEKYQLGFRIWELSVNLDSSNDPASFFCRKWSDFVTNSMRQSVYIYAMGMNAFGSRQSKVNKRSGELHRSVLVCLSPLGLPVRCLMAYAESEIVEEVIRSSHWPEDIDPIHIAHN